MRCTRGNGGLAALMLAAGALVGVTSPAPAQSASLSEIAIYEGADRAQSLLDGARREKEVTLYASIPPEDLAVLAAAFDQKYGVKVRVWRADSEGLLQRVFGEARSRRFEMDVIQASSSTLEPLARENLLQEVRSPYLADLRAQAMPRHALWVPVYLSTFVQAFNTNQLRKEELPSSYRDLLRPQWRGKLAIEAEDFDWFAYLVMTMGEAEGIELFRDIVVSNGISVRKGHSVLTNLVAAGEIDLALNDYGFLAEAAQRRGAPLEWFIMPPAIVRAGAEGVAKTAPHPNAAVLLQDFLISDAQPILAGRQFIPASRKIESSLLPATVTFIDAALMLDQRRKWQELFQRTILDPVR